MAQWAKVQRLQGDALRQVQQLYGDNFPIEVRHFLAPLIESKIVSKNNYVNPDENNLQNEQYASLFLMALLRELEMKALTLSSEEFFITKIKLQEAAKTLRERFGQNPRALLDILWNCLDIERRLLQQGENIISEVPSNPSEQTKGTSSSKLMKQLDLLRYRAQVTGEDLKRLEEDQEAFIALEHHDLTNIQANLMHLEAQVSKLIQMRIAVAKKHQESLMLIEHLQCKVLDEELIKWKREQQLAGNGAPFTGSNNLDKIQEWCEGLIEIIWLNRQQIKESEGLRIKFPISHPESAELILALNKQVNKLLSSLITSIFIIERQPPQVIKTNTRFTASVRLLVGGKLNLHITPPKVSVSIISEQQANKLLKNEKMAKADSSGEIINNIGTMEYQKETRKLFASFGNMHLKKIKRVEKKGTTESVMDEKFSFLFQSKFAIGGGDLVFQVWTLSLPIVVTVHGNQEPQSWATVTWDNAFAELGRSPFVVPYKVPWSQAAEMLSSKFREATGRYLTQDNKRFLAAKALRDTTLQEPLVEIDVLEITWCQFSKEPLIGRTLFTFWEWYYAILKLTREHLRAHWNDNTIIGFVGRKQTEEMLKNCRPGTFLLRFSDSELGGITIAWVGDQREVFMIQPFTGKDFVIRKLADRILDLKHLLYLYPDVPKDEAFGKYYTPFNDDDQQLIKGYVKPLLVTHVPGLSSAQWNR